MGVDVIAGITPKNNGSFETHDAAFGKGGFRAVADSTARDAIPTARRSEGMEVRTIADGKKWVLGNDLTTWTEVTSGGGGGNVFTYRVGAVNPVAPVYATGAEAYLAALATGTSAVIAVDDASASNTAELLPLPGGASYNFAQITLVADSSSASVNDENMRLTLQDGVTVSQWGTTEGLGIVSASNTPNTVVAANEYQLLTLSGWGGIGTNGSAPVLDVQDGGAVEIDAKDFVQKLSDGVVRLTGANAQLYIYLTGQAALPSWTATNPAVDGTVLIVCGADTAIPPDVATLARSVTVQRLSTAANFAYSAAAPSWTPAANLKASLDQLNALSLPATPQATWSIDPQNASGIASNTGDGISVPLLDDREMIRRVGRGWEKLNSRVDINFLSPRNVSDPALVIDAHCTQNGVIAIHGVPLGSSVGSYDTVRRAGTLSNWNPRWTTTKAILSSTNATPIQVTVTAHGLATGDSVQIDNHLVNTAANARAWIVTKVDADNFTLNGSAGNGAGGATGTVFRQDGSTVTDSIGGSFAAFTTGQFLLLTSGANSGAMAPIVNSDDPGIAHVGEFVANPNGTTACVVVQPAGNETYAVVQPTDLFQLSLGFSGGGRNPCCILDAIGSGDRANTPTSSAFDFTGGAGLLAINCVSVSSVFSGAGARFSTNVAMLGSEIDTSSGHLVQCGATFASSVGVPVRYLGPTCLIYLGSNNHHHRIEGDCLVFITGASFCWAVDVGLNTPDFAPFNVLPGGVLALFPGSSLSGKTGGGFASLSPFGWLLYKSGTVLRARSSDDTDVYGNGSDSAMIERGDTPLKMTWPNILAPYTGPGVTTGFGGSFADKLAQFGVVLDNID